ncbi:acetylornithine deacetylase [Neisseriaceae bacterium ESL0693]|nr:acetylornithine deacetylase [Neisseriaceae bacterium ESL0693]
MNTIDWLTKLIAFDTTSRLSNLALIDEVANYLTGLGLKPWLVHNEAGNKANLFVTIAAADGAEEGGLVLSGHTDVVPVDGQQWHSDPFVADIREERVYGRGSSDMKGFIASVLAAVPQMQAASLKVPLHIALSYDEEVGCLGAPVLLAELEKRAIRPQHCIVGEPTDMRMVVAHKGINTFCCEVHGKSVHSSLTPKGVNAIEYAARLIVFINRLAHDLQHRADLDQAFDMPFSTIGTNLIQGGSAINIVPNHCTFEFDYRNLPHMSVADIIEPIEQYIQTELLPAMQAVDADSRITLTQKVNVPPLNDQHNQLLHQLIEQLVDSDQRAKVAYATEGGQFERAGIKTVVCGPGSINVAHQANEYVPLSQLARCDRFLQQLILSQQQ